MLRNAAAVIMLCAGVLHGANRITVEGVTAQPGQQDVRVRILIDNDDPLYAVSWAASYPAGLTYRNLTLDGTVFGSTGVNAEYLQVIEGAGYVGAALLVDYDLPYEERALPAGTNQFGFALYFNVTPASGCGSQYQIDLRNDLGSPPIEAVFTTVPPGGLSRSVLPALVDGAITVSVPPTLSGVAPDTVPVGDAVTLTISGTHLTPATDVTVGGKMLVNPVFVNSTTIRGTAPSQIVGSYAVFVSNTCGLDSIPNAVQYVQDQPVILGVNPKWVRPAGGVEIAISGSNFSPDSVVTVGGAPLGQTQVVSETLIRGTVPARSTGPADVNVTNAGGSHTQAGAVVYVGQPTKKRA